MIMAGPGTCQAFHAILGRPYVQWMHGDGGFTSYRTGASTAGRQAIGATMSGNQFTCVGWAAGGTDSLDQEDITISWDGGNLHFTKVL